MAAGAHGRSRHLHDGVEDDDGVDAFSKQELARRPEVRLINSYAVVRTYVVMALKGVGALVLLWGTVVLLGGFVSSLKKIDFWYISFIAFVQAAGLFNAMFDNQLKHLMIWLYYALTKLILRSSRVKYNHDDKHVLSWPLKTIVRSSISKVMALIVFAVLETMLVFCAYGPVYCAWLSLQRLRQPGYSSAYKDASQDNLKRGLNLFYFVCVAEGLISLIAILVEFLGTPVIVKMVRRQVGLSREVILSYCVATKLKYMKDLASCDESWNLITYGAGLLDSEMPEDNASGAKLLTTLIEQGVPVRRLLLRSPRHRIQKLIGSLAWRSPADVEMRWLAARIVAHVAPDLSLSQIPGALECISSLLDTSGYYKKDDGDQEATYFAAQLRVDKKQSKQKRKVTEQVFSISSAEGTNEEIILKGLRILENLAIDEHNCKVICSTGPLLSKIVAPVSSENLIEDMTNTAWAKVTDGSLKLLSRLMRCPGDTGNEMRRKVADTSIAVKNLEKILSQKIKCCNIMVVQLQIRAIDILEQLCSADSVSFNNWAMERREYLIIKVGHIFLTEKWMEDYLSEARAKLQEEMASQLEKSKNSKKSQHQARQALVENKMKAAQESVSQLKEKAGEALATLCSGNPIASEYITGASQDVVHHLTEMLDSEESSIRCRICAALILKHLCTNCTLDLVGHYLKETTLKKVLRELLHIKTEAQAISSSKLIQWWQQTISQGRNDIENQRGSGHDERVPVVSVQEQKQQRDERGLQVALLSLCAAIRRRWMDAPEFASVVAQLASPEHLAEKLKKLVEENRYATPSCLATVKLTCELVIALIPHDHRAEDVEMKVVIVDSLYQASKTMAGLESCMLFAGTDRDCYGLPVRPFCSDLVEKAQELLRQKGQGPGLNIV